ncbi:unnamed protein product, partial [Meganyctiphanes norvegica]
MLHLGICCCVILWDPREARCWYPRHLWWGHMGPPQVCPLVTFASPTHHWCTTPTAAPTPCPCLHVAADTTVLPRPLYATTGKPPIDSWFRSNNLCSMHTTQKETTPPSLHGNIIKTNVKMELLKEARNVVDFATYYPLLNKATADNDTPTPGYVFEEILKLSQQSPGHRTHLVEFLLARLKILTWGGKQKVVRILHQLSLRGPIGVRVYLRSQDGELRRAASAGGPPDPLLANTPQLFLSSAIQELLTLLFDPHTMREDEAWLAKGGKEDSNTKESSVAQGYGSSAKGKYEGFGSSPINQSDSIYGQVRGMVERVMTPTGGREGSAMELLQGEKGDYQPLALPTLGPLPAAPQLQSTHAQLPIMAQSLTSRHRAHRAGRAGGGWESSDDETPIDSSSAATEALRRLSLGDLSLAPLEPPPGMSEEEFLQELLEDHKTWPLDHDKLRESCRKCLQHDLAFLLDKIGHSLARISSTLALENKPQNKETLMTTTCGNIDQKTALPQMSDSFIEKTELVVDEGTIQLMTLLLLIEFGLHYDIFSASLIQTNIGNILTGLHDKSEMDCMVKVKSKKICLILNKLVS